MFNQTLKLMKSFVWWLFFLGSIGLLVWGLT
jgi:hypothetical protein